MQRNPPTMFRVIRKPVFAVSILFAATTFVLAIVNAVLGNWPTAFSFGAVAAMALALAIRSALRAFRPRKIVLWLRRFHQIDRTRFPIQELMADVAVGWFHIATIQDRRFKYSFVVGVTEAIGRIIMIAWVGVLIGLFFSPIAAVAMHGVNLYEFQELPLDVRKAWFAEHRITIALFGGLFAAGCVFMFLIPATFLLARGKGVRRLRLGNVSRVIAAWCRKVKSGKSKPLTGMQIFKCDDDSWRHAVTAILDNCDAAIIDVSELNQNTSWELREANQRLGTEGIILSYAIHPQSYPAAPSPEVIQRVHDIIGKCAAESALWFGYPEPIFAEDRRHSLYGRRGQLHNPLVQAFQQAFRS